MKPRLPDTWRRWRKRRMAELIVTGMTAEMAAKASTAEAEARWQAARKFGKRAAERATVDFTDEGGAIVRGLTADANRSRLRRAIIRDAIPIV